MGCKFAMSIKHHQHGRTEAGVSYIIMFVNLGISVFPCILPNAFCGIKSQHQWILNKAKFKNRSTLAVIR